MNFSNHQSDLYDVQVLLREALIKASNFTNQPVPALKNSLEEIWKGLDNANQTK